MLPPFSRHLLKQIRSDCTVPVSMPAAGLPITRGGNTLATKAAQVFATSAVTADALPVIVQSPTHTNPAIALPDFKLANMVYHLPLQIRESPRAPIIERGD
jgi:hypothetical protein